MHSAHTNIVRCDSKEIRAELLEAKVFEVIETVMLDPVKLRKTMPFFTDDGRAAGRRRARKLEQISAQLLDVDDRKNRIIEVYASGDLSRDAYIARNRAYDAEAIELRRQRTELMQSTPLLDQRDAVDAGIAHFCDETRARLARCRDFASKRQFLLDYVEKINFIDDNVTLHGSVPIKIAISGRAHAGAETGKLEFRISDRITPEEKLTARRQARTQRVTKSSVLQVPASLVPPPAPLRPERAIPTSAS
jgi:hypothetical protein